MIGDFLGHIKDRGLFAQVTHEEELIDHLKEKRTGYIGFDPTATSLHVGHLLPILNLVRWQKMGHRPIILVGGGTGYIGDPTGKASMRSMLTLEDINQNVEKMKTQLSKYIDLSSDDKGIILNNANWLLDIKYLDFLRDIGPHFSVNKMLGAECYKSRMETGLSFLEFNYMLLQSYDFYHLHNEYDCTVELGGDDQWSNMLGGVDLIRRIKREKAFCVTSPLLLTSDGKKMGKTEGGAIWLDPDLTSPYDFYQYWRNTQDSDVKNCLNYLTLLPSEEVAELSKLEGAQINHAKEVLAFEVTKIVHGEEEARKSQEQARSVFSGSGNDSKDAPVVEIKEADFGDEMSVIALTVLAKVFSSNGEARRMIKQGGLYIKEERISDEAKLIKKEEFAADDFIIRKGKKKYFKIILS